MKRLFPLFVLLQFFITGSAQVGKLDSSYGENGFALDFFQLNKSGDTYRELDIPKMLIQPDGKFLVISRYYSVPRHDTVAGFVVRYRTNGSIDSSFGRFGFLRVDAQSVQLQPDGKIIVKPTSPANVLYRYSANGAPDRGFGNNGELFTLQSRPVLQPDGKILVAGKSGSDLAIARYHADGTPDAGFGSGGMQKIDFGGSDSATALAVLPSGKIAVGGTSRNGSTTKPVLVRLSNNGSLDNSFDGDGKLVFDFDCTECTISTLLQQADGKLMVGGSGLLSGAGSQQTAGLARFNENGSLDVSFGERGVATTTLISQIDSIKLQPDGRLLVWAPDRLIRFTVDGKQDEAFGIDGAGLYGVGIAVQPDGKIVTVSSGGSAVAVSRYFSDGNPDPGFGSLNGTEFYHLSDFNRPGDVVVLPDGRLVVLVLKRVSPGYVQSIYNHDLMRLKPDGSMDIPFAGSSVYKTSFGAITSLAIQPDGKVVVAGKVHRGIPGGTYPYYALGVARYQKNGTLDSSFGENGFINMFGFDAVDPVVALQKDGKILIGDRHWENNLLRFNVNGSRDLSFGVAGNADIITVHDIAVQANGKIVLAGASKGDNPTLVLARLNSDGTPDNTFSDDGLVNVGFVVTKVLIQPDGRILVGGSTGAPANEPAFARFMANGKPDNNFGNDGKIIISPNGATFTLAGMTLQQDGKILVGGSVNMGSSTDFVVGRLNRNGTVDGSFGTYGFTTTDFGQDEHVSEIVMQESGKILLAGYGGRNMLLVRYTTEGRLDNSFGQNGKVVTDYWLTDERVNAAALFENRIYVAGAFASTSTSSLGMVFVAAYQLETPVPAVGKKKKTDAGQNGLFELRGSLQVLAAPNPTISQFTLQLKGGTGTPVQIRVTDAAGRLAEQMSRVANQNIRLGAGYKPGIYYAEVIQGTERKVVQLLKLAQ